MGKIALHLLPHSMEDIAHGVFVVNFLLNGHGLKLIWDHLLVQKMDGQSKVANCILPLIDNTSIDFFNVLAEFRKVIKGGLAGLVVLSLHRLTIGVMLGIIKFACEVAGSMLSTCVLVF